MICAFSSKRAQKDKEDRSRLIEKAEKILEEGRCVISKRGARKYIKFETITRNEIDEEKIESEQM